MANISRYNAKDTAVVVDGVYITGLGEDMISWEKEEQYFEPVVGAQGDIVKSEINNDIYTLTITVQPTSPQLSHLISLKDRKDPFPIWCINKELGLTIGGSKANIMEMPSISLGATAEDLEVSFAVFDGTIKAS